MLSDLARRAEACRADYRTLGADDRTPRRGLHEPSELGPVDPEAVGGRETDVIQPHLCIATDEREVGPHKSGRPRRTTPPRPEGLRCPQWRVSCSSRRDRWRRLLEPVERGAKPATVSAPGLGALLDGNTGDQQPNDGVEPATMAGRMRFL